FFFFKAEDGIRDKLVTGVQTCALPIFGPAVIAIYREGDTDTVKRTLGFLALLGDLLDGSSLQPVREPLIMGTRRALGAAHLIVRSEERRVGKEGRSRWRSRQ